MTSCASGELSSSQLTSSNSITTALSYSRSTRTMSTRSRRLSFILRWAILSSSRRRYSTVRRARRPSFAARIRHPTTLTSPKAPFRRRCFQCRSSTKTQCTSRPREVSCMTTSSRTLSRRPSSLRKRKLALRRTSKCPKWTTSSTTETSRSSSR